ncbi:hypothetical protein BJX64DRAFT_186573 [Aspergillus heterothallicus]
MSTEQDSGETDLTRPDTNPSSSSTANAPPPLVPQQDINNLGAFDTFIQLKAEFLAFHFSILKARVYGVDGLLPNPRFETPHVLYNLAAQPWHAGDGILCFTIFRPDPPYTMIVPCCELFDTPNHFKPFYDWIYAVYERPMTFNSMDEVRAVYHVANSFQSIDWLGAYLETCLERAENIGLLASLATDFSGNLAMAERLQMRRLTWDLSIVLSGVLGQMSDDCHARLLNQHPPFFSDGVRDFITGRYQLYSVRHLLLVFYERFRALSIDLGLRDLPHIKHMETLALEVCLPVPGDTGRMCELDWLRRIETMLNAIAADPACLAPLRDAECRALVEKMLGLINIATTCGFQLFRGQLGFVSFFDTTRIDVRMFQSA